uniref:BMA-ABU-13, isoform d n=1 Tax=Brugia malayi TaxID=6279 RepID=A0A1I9G6W6_BRUMA|nr:BMA-ABU-13, isoform d [Brugia malayi]
MPSIGNFTLYIFMGKNFGIFGLDKQKSGQPENSLKRETKLTWNSLYICIVSLEFIRSSFLLSKNDWH